MDCSSSYLLQAAGADLPPAAWWGLADGRRSCNFLLESSVMIITPPDLSDFKEACQGATDALREALEEQGRDLEGEANTPDLLADAFLQLMDALRALEIGDGALSPGQADQGRVRHLSGLGDHGLRLLMELAAWAGRLRLVDTQRLLEGLILSFALWIARHGGELSSQLEVVVDALASLANQSRVPAELEDLYLAASEIMDAVAPPIALDLDRTQPARPWRILLLNRAIIATRAHQPALMEQAFRTLEDLLPEDAPAFFREGMGEIETLDYPEPVRVLMDRYYQFWCVPKTLH